MRKELRRSLFAAAIAGVALAGCGGGGGGGSPAPSPAPSPSPPPSPSPAPPPATAGNYFLLGRAGFSITPTANIPFVPNAPAGASAFGLVFADSTNPPAAFAVTTGAANQVEVGATTYDLASVSEYFPNGAGTATAWGTRYRVYAKANSAGTDASLYTVDLRKPTPLANPLPTQVSNGTVTSLQLCGATPPVAFDNYRSANLSWILFHALGPDGNCGTLDDKFVAVQLSTSSSMAASSLGQLEPIEPLYDTSGTITGLLAINHPRVCTTADPPPCTPGALTAPVPLEQVDATLAVVTKTFNTKLTGNGLNIAGVPTGDFLSLGVSSGNVWLYVDSANIYALDLTSGVTTPIPGFTLGTGDNIQSRAVFDGTTAYVGVNNNSAGGYVVQINTTTKTVTATQTPRDATALANLTLVGVTSSNLVYLLQDGSAIKSLVKAGLTGLAPLTSGLTATREVDGLMAAGGTSGPPTAFLVGDTVYFTVADSTAAAPFAKQAFYATFNSSGVPTTTAVASNVSAVLGIVLPSPVPTTGPVTNVGALVLTGGGNGATAGQAVFASSSVAASLYLYGSGGAQTNLVGTLSMTNPSSSSARVNPIYGVALDGGAVQTGMPAMLELFGTDGLGGNAEDIAIYSSDGATTPFAELSGFGQ